MAAHLAGDQDAFTELVRRHRDRLWAVALRTLNDREEAADAVQDALISAYRNAGSYRGDAAVTTWLHRVVVNACLDRLRRRKARPADALGDREVTEPIDEHRRTEARLDVRAALATLPEPQRAALVLVDLHDYSVSEAAQILGVAEGTVKSRCSRARTALALQLRPASTSTPRSGGSHAADAPAEHVPDDAPTASVTTAPAAAALRRRRVAHGTPADSDPDSPQVDGTPEIDGNRAATRRVGPTGADLHPSVSDQPSRDGLPPVPPTSNLASGGW